MFHIWPYMNPLQFYYIQEVLGVQTGIKPSELRSAYRLSRPVARQTDFLFVCDRLKTAKEKSLVKNIAKALKAEEEQVVEILDRQHQQNSVLLQNLLARLCPKGFVIFGQELAEKLISSSKLSKPFPYSLSIPATPYSQALILGCVIHSISQMSDLDPTEGQANKQKTWQVLHKTFLT